MLLILAHCKQIITIIVWYILVSALNCFQLSQLNSASLTQENSYKNVIVTSHWHVLKDFIEVGNSSIFFHNKEIIKYF